MRARLEDIIYKLEKCYDVSMDVKYIGQFNVYEVKASIGRFNKSCYIDNILYGEWPDEQLSNWLEDNCVWPVIKAYRRSIGEYILSDFVVEEKEKNNA